MINNVTLVGRLTKDIELKKTNSGLSTCKFILACDKKFTSKDNQGPKADFISCQAWRQAADYLGKYAHKGTIIALEGHIQTGSYEGANGTVYTTDVVCENVKIISQGKKEDNSQSVNEQVASNYRQANATPSYEEQPLYQAPNTSGQVSSQDVEVDTNDLPFY